MDRFYGKYRGKVKNNTDPLMLGRVQVEVPAVLGDGRMSWAMPCAPYAGSGVGFFFIPPVDANVWVEFEGGDLDYPIYSGGFWGVGQVPATPAIPEMKIIKTDNASIVINELPGVGGLTIEVTPPLVPLPFSLVIDVNGIKIDGGPLGVIELTPAGVKINSGALEVT